MGIKGRKGPLGPYGQNGAPGERGEDGLTVRISHCLLYIAVVVCFFHIFYYPLQGADGSSGLIGVQGPAGIVGRKGEAGSPGRPGEQVCCKNSVT